MRRESEMPEKNKKQEIKKEKSQNEEQKTERRERMEQEAIRQLLHSHEKGPKQKVKDMVKKAAGRYVAPTDIIFWPAGLLANALMELGTERGIAAVKQYFDLWINKGMPLYYVDDTLCGTALMLLYQKTGEAVYKTGADKMAQYLFRLESENADDIGSIPYRPAQKNAHIYVDGIGMMCPFLAMYGVECGEEKAVLTALTQIRNMLEYGIDEETGLPYHGFGYENRIKYGIIGWGRAVGWLLMGISGVLKALRSPKASACYQAEVGELEEACRSLLKAVRPWLKENGGFAWQLQAIEGPEDSSATAMIARTVKSELLYSIKENEREEWSCLLARMSGFLAECETNGSIGQCLGECLGFSQYPQVYGAYPWSLGTALEVLG